MTDEERLKGFEDPEKMEKYNDAMELRQELMFTTPTIEKRELSNYVDWDSFDMLDEKIEAAKAALDGKRSDEIPHYDEIQTLRPDKEDKTESSGSDIVDVMWD